VPPWWQPGLATHPNPALPWRQPDLACRCYWVDLPISTTSISIGAIDPARSRPTMHLAPPDRVTPPPSCRLAGYTRSPAAISFWLARSLIEIESPTARRPRAYYSSIGIDWAYRLGHRLCISRPSTAARPIGSSLTPLPSTTRIFSEQQGCCCVASSGHSTAACVSASLLHLHRLHLCIDDYAAPSVCTRSSSSSRRYPRCR
jgi:hypothetical protein